MSYQEDQEKLNDIINKKVVSVKAVSSDYGDDFTSYVLMIFDDGTSVTFSPRAFSDGSSMLDVDVL